MVHVCGTGSEELGGGAHSKGAWSELAGGFCSVGQSSAGENFLPVCELLVTSSLAGEKKHARESESRKGGQILAPVGEFCSVKSMNE